MKKLIIFGAGGFAKEVADTIGRINRINNTYKILGFIDEREELHRTEINGLPVLGGDEIAIKMAKEEQIYGVLGLSSSKIKRAIVRKMGDLIEWETIVDPTGCISSSSQIGRGTVIQPFSIIGPNVKVRDFCTINCRCTIGHDSLVENYVSAMVSCDISGNVCVKEDVYLGSGVKIIPSVTIGKGVTVGAGATVVKSVEGVCADDCRHTGETFGEKNKGINFDFYESTIPVIIFGTAGAAKDVYYWIRAINKSCGKEKFHVEGFIENDSKTVGRKVFNGERIIGCDDDIGMIIQKYKIIGMVIPFGNPKMREKIVNKVAGYPNVVFPNIIHPSVTYDGKGGMMGKGNHIGPGVVVESTFTFGDFNYISGDAHLGHDIILGNYNSINPSATAAGNVIFKNRCMLGINATVNQEITISDDIIIGAGAVVVKDLDVKGTYVGVPAKLLREAQENEKETFDYS